MGGDSGLILSDSTGALLILQPLHRFQDDLGVLEQVLTDPFFKLIRWQAGDLVRP